MMKILLAVDNSPHSQEAIREVATRAWPPGTTVRVLTAVEKVVLPAGDLWVSVDDYAWKIDTERATQLLGDVAKRLRSSDLVVETAMREGTPHSVIVEEAKQWSADLIVVGSRGHTGLKRIFLHSVAQSVVSHAPCPVEVVRHKKT